MDHGPGGGGDKGHDMMGGGGMGGMMGMSGGINDALMGSSITAPALQSLFGVFPKLELFQKINSISKFKKEGAKRMSLWYGPLQLPSLEVHIHWCFGAVRH
jgi:hypothetical protein